MDAMDIRKSTLKEFMRRMILTRCNRRSKVSCNSCKKEIDLRKGLYHCAICQHDECSECSGHNLREKQKEEAKKLALGLNLPGKAAEEEKAKEEAEIKELEQEVKETEKPEEEQKVEAVKVDEEEKAEIPQETKEEESKEEIQVEEVEEEIEWPDEASLDPAMKEVYNKLRKQEEKLKKMEADLIEREKALEDK